MVKAIERAAAALNAARAIECAVSANCRRKSREKSLGMAVAKCKSSRDAEASIQLIQQEQ